MIARRSYKRMRQEREYYSLRREFLRLNPICEVKGCRSQAHDVHHMAGRCGDLLTDISKFMAVCRAHHNYIESHPVEARERGYSLSRLGLQ